MPDATFACPDLTTFCRLDELGLEATGQRLESDRAVLACRVIEPDQWCRRCGWEGAPRDTVLRRLALLAAVHQGNQGCLLSAVELGFFAAQVTLAPAFGAGIATITGSLPPCSRFSRQ